MLAEPDAQIVDKRAAALLPDLVALSRQVAAEGGVADRVRFVHRNAFDTELREATVVTFCTGSIVTVADWRWIFWINLPVGAVHWEVEPQLLVKVTGCWATKAMR